MENFGNVKSIFEYMNGDGIAEFDNAQIPDFTRSVEFIVTDNPISLQLNTKTALKPNYKAPTYPKEARVPVDGTVMKGEYFYFYSKPLHNYWHTLSNALSCIPAYFKLKKTYPKLKLLINRCHKKIMPNPYPPFVKEMLDLLKIPFEFTNQHSLYEKLFFGGDYKCYKHGAWSDYFSILDTLIENSLKQNLDVPRYEKIYISRRTKYNSNYSKALLGEDNTQKRRCVNEDEIVEILSKYGFQEVFGENYTLAEKITIFHHVKKYVTFMGAGITNILFSKNGLVGAISSPNFSYPNAKRDHILNRPYFNKQVFEFDDTSTIDSNVVKYNNLWKINNLDNFDAWAGQL